MIWRAVKWNGVKKKHATKESDNITTSQMLTKDTAKLTKIHTIQKLRRKSSRDGRGQIHHNDNRCRRFDFNTNKQKHDLNSDLWWRRRTHCVWRIQSEGPSWVWGRERAGTCGSRRDRGTCSGTPRTSETQSRCSVAWRQMETSLTCTRPEACLALFFYEILVAASVECSSRIVEVASCYEISRARNFFATFC